METTYTIRSGDTLGKIAARFYGDSNLYCKIAEANNITDPNKIRVGQVLVIPEVTEAESGVTSVELKEIMPNAKESNIEQFTSALNSNLQSFRVTTILRKAHFLAQIAVESASLNATSENLNYSAEGLRKTFGKYFPDTTLADEYARQPEKIANRVYANRMGNGDEESGDGWRYRGRGLIQLTGKDNYIACGKAIGLDLENNPDLVAESADVATRVCCWYWESRTLNDYADIDDIVTITKKINGGSHGLEMRQSFLEKAKKVLRG